MSYFPKLPIFPKGTDKSDGGKIPMTELWFAENSDGGKFRWPENYPEYSVDRMTGKLGWPENYSLFQLIISSSSLSADHGDSTRLRFGVRHSSRGLRSCSREDLWNIHRCWAHFLLRCWAHILLRSHRCWAHFLLRSHGWSKSKVTRMIKIYDHGWSKSMITDDQNLW